jgi:hypothetical protein
MRREKQNRIVWLWWASAFVGGVVSFCLCVGCKQKRDHDKVVALETQRQRSSSAAADARTEKTSQTAVGAFEQTISSASFVLERSQAARFAVLALGCVNRPYPNKPSNVLASKRDLGEPQKLHPAFFGCYDWHSAVHAHWTLVRLYRRFPRLEQAGRIRQVLDAHLTPARLAAERAYFAKDHHKLFERPYGWGWYLRLCLEVAQTGVRRWIRALAPLETLIRNRFMEYLDNLSVPVRAGTHASTAFALVLAYDYAVARKHRKFARAIERAARRFYLQDTRCPLEYEPSGEDFISPCLAEADLMRRVLSAKAFAAWTRRFLPPSGSRRWRTVLTPPQVTDPKDPRIGHLIGLCFQRAWALLGVAESLRSVYGKRRGAADIKKRRAHGLALITDLTRAAVAHRKAGLRMLENSGYGGKHWLASFAVYLLSGVDRPVRAVPNIPRNQTTPSTGGEPK